MARTRESYDDVMPSLPNILKYMHMCDHWIKVIQLQTLMGVNRSTPERMCRRLHRHGLLDRRLANTERGRDGYEYRSSEQGRWLFQAVMDGRIEVGFPVAELGPGSQCGSAVEGHGGEAC
jgi:hypothetical protein